MKTNGLKEVQALRARTTRSLALNRIGMRSHEYIVGRCNEIEAHIISMDEYDTEEEEDGDG